MNRREFFRKTMIAPALPVFLFLGSPTQAADPAAQITILITYHSVSGNTEKMAQGVAEGAKAVPGTRVVLKRVGEVGTEDLLSSDAVIVGSPVYFGNMSGEVKTFFDNWLLKFAVSATSKCAIRSVALSLPERRSRTERSLPFWPSWRRCS